MTITLLVFAFLFMLIGGIGFAASFYFPHERKYSSDHAIGAGLSGLGWLICCLILAIITLKGQICGLK
jgi:hypothetical protein